MYPYNGYDENSCFQQDVSQDVSQDTSNVYAEQATCFRTRMGRVCRDPRSGIECVYPRNRRPFCYRFR
jgi:hypothetical protein